MSNKNTTVLKGLLCSIFEDKDGHNCSNNGISARCKQVIVVGPGIPEIFEASEDCPAVKLVRRNLFGKEYVHAEPVDQPEGLVGPMAGGAFIYSCDSRFRKLNEYPISLHDRFETQAQYNALTV